MSARAARSRKTPAPSGRERSITTLSLLVFRWRKSPLFSGSISVAGKGTHTPGRIPARPLHLDNSGPEVRQHLGAVRPGDPFAEIDDQEPGERL